MLQTQKTSTNVESKEDDIEVEQSIGNHVEDGCFLALLLPPNTLRGMELLVMLPLKSICRTRTHQKIAVTIRDDAVWNSVGRFFEFLKELSFPVL
jgi:hypothetical protein